MQNKSGEFVSSRLGYDPCGCDGLEEDNFEMVKVQNKSRSAWLYEVGQRNGRHLSQPFKETAKKPFQGVEAGRNADRVESPTGCVAFGVWTSGCIQKLEKGADVDSEKGSLLRGRNSGQRSLDGHHAVEVSCECTRERRTKDASEAQDMFGVMRECAAKARGNEATSERKVITKLTGPAMDPDARLSFESRKIATQAKPEVTARVGARPVEEAKLPPADMISELHPHPAEILLRQLSDSYERGEGSQRQEGRGLGHFGPGHDPFLVPPPERVRLPREVSGREDAWDRIRSLPDPDAEASAAPVAGGGATMCLPTAPRGKRLKLAVAKPGICPGLKSSV